MLSHPLIKTFNRYFGRPEVLALFAVLICIYLTFVFFSQMLAPVFASIVIAYLLQWPINKLESLKFPHAVSVLLVFFIFMGTVVVTLLWLLPLLWHQLNNLLVQLPKMMIDAQHMFDKIYERYPQLSSSIEFQQTVYKLKAQTLTYGQNLLSFSLSSLSNLIVVCVYFILVPLLVYFFLMDKKPLLSGFKHYLPKRRKLLSKVWGEIYDQIGYYVRGKVIEALIVAVVFFIFFHLIGLDYPSLMAVLVGLSVIIPYIGAVLVTIPVFIIAVLQWGINAYFGYFVIIYGLLIALDANMLVPLIFAEAVDLHPVSIILAILIFGGLFGFWGVFFAIPLASVVKAIAGALAENPVER